MPLSLTIYDDKQSTIDDDIIENTNLMNQAAINLTQTTDQARMDINTLTGIQRTAATEDQMRATLGYQRVITTEISNILTSSFNELHLAPSQATHEEVCQRGRYIRNSSVIVSSYFPVHCSYLWI